MRPGAGADAVRRRTTPLPPAGAKTTPAFRLPFAVRPLPLASPPVLLLRHWRPPWVHACPTIRPLPNSSSRPHLLPPGAQIDRKSFRLVCSTRSPMFRSVNTSPPVARINFLMSSRRTAKPAHYACDDLEPLRRPAGGAQFREVLNTRHLVPRRAVVVRQLRLDHHLWVVYPFGRSCVRSSIRNSRASRRESSP